MYKSKVDEILSMKIEYRQATICYSDSSNGEFHIGYFVYRRFTRYIYSDSGFIFYDSGCSLYFIS